MSTTFNWAIPITNTDGTTITAGEITGFHIGTRQGGVAGTYPTLTPVASPTATSATATFAPGTYNAAISTVGPVNSAFSSEITFTVAQPVPNPPTGFSAS
jgi:hypothetical protein